MKATIFISKTQLLELQKILSKDNRWSRNLGEIEYQNLDWSWDLINFDFCPDMEPEKESTECVLIRMGHINCNPPPLNIKKYDTDMVCIKFTNKQRRLILAAKDTTTDPDRGHLEICC